MYNQQNAQAGGAAGAQAEPNAGQAKADDDEVTDVDFEEVK
jgi:hypothetical protein